jgi:hypothetical protein
MNKVISKASINLKLSDDLKEKIKSKADAKQQTVSQYMRQLLSNYYDGSLCKNEIAKNERKEFINSTNFLQLVVWMYSIKRSNKFKERQEDVDNYIRTLKKVDEHFPDNLIAEFNKVLSDLIRVTNENSIIYKDYKFANGYTSTPEFNFEILERYLLSFGIPIVVPSFKALEIIKKT